MENTNKFNNFFIQSKILTEDECNLLNDCVEFSLDRTNPNQFCILIDNKKVISPDIFVKLFKFHKESINKNLTIKFLNLYSTYTADEIVEYFKYFINFKNLDLDTYKSVLINKPFSQCEDKLLIKYISNFELSNFKKIKDNFLSFLKTSLFKINDIDFQMLDNEKTVSLYKKTMDEKITNSFKSISDSARQMKIVTNENKIKSNTVTPIDEIDSNTQRAIIEGQIFNIDVTITKKTNRKIYSFSITDYKSGIIVKVFPNDSSSNSYQNKQNVITDEYIQTFKKGDWVKIRATFSIDNYQNNQVTGIANQIMKINCPKQFVREDNSTKKRIELLCHTKMTAFDGICSASEVVERAKSYGWECVAPIDRFNVQSFPEIFSISKKTKQKVVYGCEMNVINRNNLIVKNPRDENLETSEFIVFDIETSGLYSYNNDLIEFGAIRIKNGVEVDRIDFFVKPSKPISYFISNKTHITNEVLQQHGIDIHEALKKIKDYVKDLTLIAHNGIKFDYRFINNKLEQYGFEPLTNPIIDTMQLSRYLNEKATQHNLGTISRGYKLVYNDEIAHRADFDAAVLFEVWKIMVSELKKQNITNLQQLSTLNNESLYTRQFAENFVDIYCKNQASIKKMYELVSIASTDNFYNMPRLFKDNIEKNREYFLIANSPVESDVFDVAFNSTTKELEKVINFYDYIFVSSPQNLLHEIHRENFSLKDAEAIILKIINVSKKLGKKVIAVSDGYYLDIWDQIAHRVYVNSKLLGGKSHRLHRYDQSNEILPDYHVRTTEEMLKEFDFLNDKKLIEEIVIDNGYDFIKQIDNEIKPLQDKLNAPKISDAEEKLKEYVKNKSHEMYGENLPEIVSKRIDKELNSIINNKFSVIYWIAHLLVLQSLSDGFLVGSRGSVGSSLVAHFLDITEVNALPAHYLCKKCHYSDFNVVADDGFDLPPKKCPVCGEMMYGQGHNIPFETFLGFHGEKVPDIDLNFSGLYQANAHNFIKKMFGAEHSFRAGTIATVAEKTAYGYVKNYFENEGKTFKANPVYIEWIKNKCTDVKRTTGQHPGGIVIVPNEMSIFDFCPYNFPADDKTQDWYTTHFPFESLHDTLLKFDILGHDDPTKLKLLEEYTGIDAKTIPFYDPKIMKLFTSIEPLGITSEQANGEKNGAIGLPEFGTSFVRGLLNDSQPQSFADLIRISGLSHGTDVWLNNAQTLIRDHHLTLSQVVGCRDDIMTYLIKCNVDPLVAFSTMESVRKGKGIKPNDMEVIKSNNVPQWYIDSCLKIKYLFPKAHATAYVIMAWRIAWFKVNYPLAFYATFLTIQSDLFDIKTILAGPTAIKEKINKIKSMLNNNATKKDVKNKDKDLIPIYEIALEMYARGFGFKCVDLEKSEASKYVIDGNCLIPPFTAIDGLGIAAAESVVKARKEKPFVSKEDLMQRTQLNKTVLDFLNELGVTDKLKDNNQLSLFDDLF